MTVLEAIRQGADELEGHGVESARRNLEEMLAHVLGLPRLQLYLNFERALTASELETLRAMIARRAQREPLQHILGSVSFCGVEIAVQAGALVPRPETELLAERAWQFLQQVESHPPTALDFGTGTGCLAIVLALKVPGAEIDALDVSSEALALARQNAGAHQLGRRLKFHSGDGFQALSRPRHYDLIVSNPPYIPSAEIEVLEPEVREFDPRLALDGGADGLHFYRQLATQAGSWLNAPGRMMLEFGDGQGDALRELFSAQNWIVEAIEEDYSRQPRILVARKNL